MREKSPRKPEPVDESPLGTLYTRRRELVPTPGSQRRCYDGCLPSSDWEWVWGAWEPLFVDVPESKLEFWVSIARSSTEYKWMANES